MITSAPIHAWCLVKGEWLEREDPVMSVCDPYGGDVRAAIARLGYEAWCQFGVDVQPRVPISLVLYSREAPPLQFLLQLEGNAGNVVEHIFAETLPDALDLLARWAPLAYGLSYEDGFGRSEGVERRPVGAGDVMGRPDDHEPPPGRRGGGDAAARWRPDGDRVVAPWVSADGPAASDE